MDMVATRPALEGARMSAMEQALATLTLTGGRRNWIKIFLAVAALLVYGLAFIPPYRFQEMGIVELIAMPVLVAAWIFGFWAGLLAAMVSIPLNAFLLEAVGQPGWALLAETQTLSGSILVLVLGAVFGGLRDMGVIMQNEFAARKRVELARDQSEERYRIVAEGASDAVFTLDEGGRITFANPARGAARPSLHGALARGGTHRAARHHDRAPGCAHRRIGETDARAARAGQGRPSHRHGGLLRAPAAGWTALLHRHRA
jgi:PAS domain-containing protein